MIRIHPVFQQHVERVALLFGELDRCVPVAFTDKISSEPGVYLFLEGDTVERVGRSNNLRKRLKSHLQADHNSGAYAFKRARQRLGLSATYRKESSRKVLQQNAEFVLLFREEIARLRSLTVKYVEVSDPVDQYLLELYAAVSYNLPLDEFGNH